MKLRIGSFSEMAENIKVHSSRIVMFGAGVIGTSITPALLESFGLVDLVVCSIDNDKTKWGGSVRIGQKTVTICSPDILYTLSENVTVLINVSRYADVFDQLEQMECTQNMFCYIIPMMCIENFRNEGGKGVIVTSNTPVIPKKIHYIWFGGGDIPQNLQRSIDSWRKYCPDYEIIRWDESNYDVRKCLYMRQAYQHKRYSFVTDYAKIDILYNYGGIYMDTDVEVIRSLDDLLYQEAFTSVEKWQVINFGGCSGAVCGHPSLEAYLQAWEKRELIREDGTLDTLSSGYVDTRVALDNGFTMNGQNQTVLGMNIYTYDYFHPYDYMSGRTEITDDTYAIHRFNGGWLDEDMRIVNQQSRMRYESLYQRARREDTKSIVGWNE
ncbi:MAG: hypothetical protein K2N34_00725 [Lachnospiraceae bacterium]|nr:hypothetical protein [Lachnospiraceae bacterium]